MKFEIGDIVLLLHSNEEAEVVDIINEKMVIGRPFNLHICITMALIFVWAVYLALIIMRWKFSQGGRRFAWGAVFGFLFVLLTFWGSSLLSPIHKPIP